MDDDEIGRQVHERFEQRRMDAAQAKVEREQAWAAACRNLLATCRTSMPTLVERCGTSLVPLTTFRSHQTGWRKKRMEIEPVRVAGWFLWSWTTTETRSGGYYDVEDRFQQFLLTSGAILQTQNGLSGDVVVPPDGSVSLVPNAVEQLQSLLRAAGLPVPAMPPFA